jgi:hypothetical protein
MDRCFRNDFRINQYYQHGNVVDTNTTNFATVNLSPINLLIPTVRLTVKSNTGEYPAGTFGGFTLTKSANLLTINALDYITITFYKGTTVTESRTSGGLFSGQFITSASNQFYVGFTATKAFDRMKIEINPGIESLWRSNTTFIMHLFSLMTIRMVFRTVMINVRTETTVLITTETVFRIVLKDVLW